MTPRLAALPLVLLLVQGCASTQGGGRKRPKSVDTQALQAEVRGLSQQAELLLERQDALIWRSWTQGEHADIARTYEGTAGLVSRESIATVDALLSRTTDEQERRGLLHLKTFLVGEYLARALSEETRAIANLEASLAFSEGGRDHAYRDLPRLLATEQSAARRKALYDAATPAVQRLSSSIQRRFEQLDAALREVGYPTARSYASELRQADAGRLAALAEALLEETQAPYEAVLDRLAREELGVERSALTAADLPRLFRPSTVDDYFPKERFLERLSQAVGGMGFDLGRMKNLTVDAEERPVKHPRALCLGVKVPGDVRLSLMPGRGVRGEASALHELGRALQLSHVGPLPFELAKLGASSVGEAYGLLLEDLVAHPLWLEETVKLGGQRQARHLSTLAVYRLFQLRRDAARLLYELRVQGESRDDAQALYQALFSRALGIPFDAPTAARYLVERDELFGAATAFRAYFLAAQLAEALERAHGERWWRSEGAGETLRGLYAKGNALGAQELGQALGAEGIRMEPLLLRLERALGVPFQPPGTPDGTP